MKSVNKSLRMPLSTKRWRVGRTQEGWSHEGERHHHQLPPTTTIAATTTTTTTTITTTTVVSGPFFHLPSPPPPSVPFTPLSLLRPARISLPFPLSRSLYRCVRTFLSIIKNSWRLCWWPCRRSARDVCTNGGVYPRERCVPVIPDAHCLFLSEYGAFCSLFLACRGH